MDWEKGFSGKELKQATQRVNDGHQCQQQLHILLEEKAKI
jgi:hypothetical protein